jgi:hypothetical protein
MPNVSVKVLSGDIITLDVLPTITCREFYTRVYEELPAEILPEYEYQMSLMREKKTDEEEEQEHWDPEVDYDDNPLEPSEEEMFFAVFDTTEYWTEERDDVIAYAVERREDHDWSIREYVVYRMNPSDGIQIVHRGRLFEGEWEGCETWLTDNDVKWEWSSRYTNQINFDFPEEDSHSPYYPSMRWAIKGAFEYLQGVNKRVQAHLVEEWMWKSC